MRSRFNANFDVTTRALPHINGSLFNQEPEVTDVIQPILPAAPQCLGIELAQADWFMKQEAERIGQKIQTFLQAISVDSNCYLTISYCNVENKWLVGSLFQASKAGKFMMLLPECQQKQLLSVLLTDKSLMNDMLWLQSSFEQLANSVEVLSFSKCYEANRDNALTVYSDLFSDDFSLNTQIVFFEGKFVWTVIGGNNPYYISK